MLSLKKSIVPLVLIFILTVCDVAVSKSGIPAEWSMDTDCALCHTHEADTLTNEKCLIYAHSEESCTSCHSQEDRLAVAHRKMSTDTSKLKRLKRTKMGEENCIACHGGWEDLSERTKDTVLVQDSEGTIVNPHIVRTEINKSKQHNLVTCTSCHRMHTETNLAEAANEACRTCHHAGVYKCGTCHN
ncbi:hypothetical protein EP073_10590 [Geovibrio thiophilus]|uniref:Tetrahaem cytochrome domain-containing protein n=1 Tax=Geovibrio thiophilus TaxID=139438 RepID=A0A410K0P1_9BACT|nr:cytochrome c3 family protein [Geovibrio thiophilus]QAR33838.1 hypothetical protein EP073_10590 [Geovibrio thiophilus]